MSDRPEARRVRDAMLRAWLSAPPQWLRRISGGTIERDGRVLDAHVQALLFAMRVAGIRDEKDVDRARRAMDLDLGAVGPKPAPMREVRDVSLELESTRLAGRLYVPADAGASPPLLVYFHGGGFVVGSIRSHEAAVRELATNARLAVLSVEYRLAPEHRAPAAAVDAHGAYLWACRNAGALGIDAERIGVGGDSAGANVSAVVCQLCRDRGERQPGVQLLVYPATDLTCSMGSHRTFHRGFLLESERIDWYLAHYLTSRSQRREPMVSPLFWPRFDGLAPAIVVTAGFDPLLDEGEAYAERLRSAGVAVTYRCEDGLVHGFFNLSGVVPAAQDANRAIARDLRRVLA